MIVSRTRCSVQRCSAESRPTARRDPGSATHHAQERALHCVRGTYQSFRNTIDAIQPVISAIAAVTKP